MSTNERGEGIIETVDLDMIIVANCFCKNLQELISSIPNGLCLSGTGVIISLTTKLVLLFQLVHTIHVFGVGAVSMIISGRGTNVCAGRKENRVTTAMVLPVITRSQLQVKINNFQRHFLYLSLSLKVDLNVSTDDKKQKKSIPL